MIVSAKRNSDGFDVAIFHANVPEEMT